MCGRNAGAILGVVLLIGCSPTLPLAPKATATPGPHGGQMQTSGPYLVELAAKVSGTSATVDVYVTDRARLVVKPDTPTAQFIAEDGHAQTLKLATQADHLGCVVTLEDKGEYSVVVLGKVAGAPLKGVFSFTRP
jgi:hypothetical protein